MKKEGVIFFNIKFFIIFLIFPILSKSQILKKFDYAGFSINLSPKWIIKKESTINSPLFVYITSSNIAIGIKLTKIPNNTYPIISQSEANKIKPQMVTSLRQRGVVVNTFTMVKSTFKNKDCFKINGLIKDPEYFNGISQYYNTIQLIHNGYLFNIICNIPVSNNSDKEINFIKSQLETIQFY